jgi:subtilisin family serine protease
VLDSNGSGSFSNVISALQWAVDHGIQVTNNSYGSSQNPGTLLETAFNNANAAGVLNIAAAGNSGTSAGNTNTVGTRETTPRSWRLLRPTSTTSARTGRARVRASISRRRRVDQFHEAGGGYIVYSGTSMATPHVVGVAALVLAAVAAASRTQTTTGDVNDEGRNILLNTAADLGTAGLDSWYGFGLVQAQAAVAAAQRWHRWTASRQPHANVSEHQLLLGRRKRKQGSADYGRWPLAGGRHSRVRP